MAKLDHTEAGFEKLIVDHMTSAGGWSEGQAARYDRDLGLYPDDLVAFIKGTQGKAWEKLVKHSGGESAAGKDLCKRVAQQLTARGTIDLIRKGVREKNIAFRLCYFRPNLRTDETGLHLYNANRLTVVRQVHHDARRPQDSIDLVLFVNGLPTATAELKNRYSATGWDVEEAIRQYREDRDARNVLLGERALVHFALDADLAYMTTKLAGEGTRFLPFNQGSGGPGRYGGKGNPLGGSGHPTAYLWEHVWHDDAWLELLDSFVFDEGEGPTRATVFPRYHQWDVVRTCVAHAGVHGAGQNYLVQHSAGSGKTKEIAWLAHELSVLHEPGGRLVFDKVIVITDRRILDAQLQRQVRAFAQTHSAVVEIDEDSTQLLDALAGKTAKVVITTLQKFPFVLQKLAGEDVAEQLKGGRYAVIVDEAHSSQTGNAAVDLKAVIGSRSVDDLDLEPEEQDGVPLAMLAQMAARGSQPNISYFAFTATPKGRTLELFGTSVGTPDETFEPFHIYSMRQAIEEGFILDVLRNYTTYEQLYRLEDRAEKEVPKGKAMARIARFAEFHPYVKTQKARVVIDHYRRIARPQLGGEGKAMVVCSSREEAVRWKQALDRIAEQEGIPDVRILVAFSGEVEITDQNAADFGETYREAQMNAIAGRPLPEKQLPTEFDKPEYGILVVAEKYQTGFDQPKLVAMYVDKKLSGINAVQTLSRLNRVHPTKTETFVLDFINDADEVLRAFEQYHGATEGLPSDPNVLSDAAQTVLDRGVIDDDEVDAFAAIYAPEASHHDLSAHTKRAYAASQNLSDDERFDFRGDLDRFVRFYKFLSQVAPYLAVEHEKLFQFARFLALRLRAHAEGGVSVADSIELTHYRLIERSTIDLGLGGDDTGSPPLNSIRGTGTGSFKGEVPMGLLGELIEMFNSRFGAELSDADAIRPVQQLIEKTSELGEAQGLRAQAIGNSFQDFERGKESVVIDATLQVKDINDLVLQKLLDDDSVRQQMTHLVMRALYDRYTAERSET